jgi:AraC-like DNA-binding protein
VNSDFSLSSITRLCGFEDQSWFSKIFKDYTGISPKKYRERGGRTAELSTGRIHHKAKIRTHKIKSRENTNLIAKSGEKS